MKLLLKRIAKQKTYTIGKLYVDGVYECDTLEDTDRGLSDDMSVEEIKKKKIYGQTAIPTGTYEVTLDVYSPKFGAKTFYKQVCDGKVPRLLNIKGFEGILIHVGEGYNGARLTEGCILVGDNTIKGGLTNSKECFQKLYDKLKMNNKEKITIEII